MELAVYSRRVNLKELRIKGLEWVRNSRDQFFRYYLMRNSEKEHTTNEISGECGPMSCGRQQN
jgi:hypothetical protein